MTLTSAKSSSLLERIAVVLNGRATANGYDVKCPCHDDRENSLSLATKEDRLLWHCKAGCSQDAVKGGLESILGESLGADVVPIKPKYKEVIFPYSQDGKTVVYEKVKRPGVAKGLFRHFHLAHDAACKKREGQPGSEKYQPCAHLNQTAWWKPSCPTFLYAQPKLDRLRGKVPIVVCEGEKDANTINKLFGDEYVGVTNDNGGGIWTIEHAKLLHDCDIIIAEDCDETGIRRTQNILARGQFRKCLGVLRFAVSEVGEKGDVTDWIERGATVEQLRTRLKSGLSPITDGDKQTEHLRNNIKTLSDTGNADRLIAMYGDRLRYSYDLDMWLCWNGRFWERSKSIPVELAKNVAREILNEAAATKGDNYKDLARHALASENYSRIKAMLQLAQSIPGVSISMEQLDANPDLLNVQNGTIDLTTGELLPFDSKHLITKIIEIPYTRSESWTEGGNWMNFLSEIFKGDAELISYVQRVVGYTLGGHISERKIFFLWGDGRNGKSTFVNALARILGQDYSKRLPISALLKKKSEGIPNDIAQLKGARLAYCSEAPEGKELDEAFVKDASGGEKITARFMRGEWFSFTPEFKLWLSTNHKPEIQGSDDAIWDRIALIPFEFRVPEGEIDPDLGSKLAKEDEFLLEWAVLGAVSWRKIGLATPFVVRQASENYRNEMNVVREFINQCCIKGDLYSVKVSDLIEAFRIFSGQTSFTRNKFNKLVIAEGIPAPKVGTGNYAFWNGIGLRSD